MRLVRLKSGKIWMLIGLVIIYYSGCDSPESPGANGQNDTGVDNGKIVLIEPDDHFRNALEAYANRDFGKSYAEIHKAIRYMEGIDAAATGKEQKSISDAIQDLTDLAPDVKNDRVDGILEIRYFFARAGAALAGNRIRIIEELNDSDQSDSIHYNPDIALARLKNSKSYYGREFNDAEKQILADAGEISGKLLKNKGVNKVVILKMTQNLRKTMKNPGDIDQHFEDRLKADK